MSRGATIALGAGVVALAGVGGYLYWRRTRPANPTDSRVGGSVPLFGAGAINNLNPNGPPLPAANKSNQVFQKVTGAVQQGTAAVKAGATAFEEGKKAWDDIKGYFG